MRRFIYGFLCATLLQIVVAEEQGKDGVVIERVAGRYGLTEGPHWDHKTQKLYFVDIHNQKICRLDPVSGEVTSTVVENGPVGFVIPVEDMPDKYVAGVGTDFAVVTWNSEQNSSSVVPRTLATVSTNRTGVRWNDAKADSAGRLWGGTMGREVGTQIEPNMGALYRIGGDLVPKVEQSPVSISNGLAWSIEDDTMYYIDSPTYQVFAFDFNPVAGTISNKRVVFDLRKNNVTGIPDGMTIDTDGNLWIAVYNGGCVLNVNPKTGKLIRTVKIPGNYVTSVAFGGPLLDTLYVTTSSNGLSEDQKKEDPGTGYVYAVKGLGVRGLLANSFRMESNA